MGFIHTVIVRGFSLVICNIISANFLYSSPKLSLMKDLGDEVAFVGRSNAGKSSLINALLVKNLAKTSKTPGRTKHAVVYEVALTSEAGIKKTIVVDLPGYGFANMSKVESKDSQELLWEYLNFRQELKAIFLLVDARRDLDEREIEIIDFCKSKRIQLFLILTKVDKIVKSKRKPVLHKIGDQLSLEKEHIMFHSVFEQDSTKEIRQIIYGLIK